MSGSSYSLTFFPEIPEPNDLLLYSFMESTVRNLYIRYKADHNDAQKILLLTELQQEVIKFLGPYRNMLQAHPAMLNRNLYSIVSKIRDSFNDPSSNADIKNALDSITQKIESAMIHAALHSQYQSVNRPRL